MGNKATTLLPPLEQMLKTFTPTELQALEARFPHQQHKSTSNGKKGAATDDHSSSRTTSPHTPPQPPPPYITKDQFLVQLSDGLGPSTRRVLLRLFHVLDANASGTLEYEEHVAAAFFLTKATQAERARVLFSMYESQSGPSSPAAASSGAGGSSSSSAKGHLSKSDVASLCAETTLALAELQQQDGGGYGGGGGGGGSTSQVTSLAHIDTNAAPFKELVSVMVDVAFARFDADRDGRFSLAEFRNFVTQQYENGVEELLELIAASPHVPRMLWATGVNGGGGGGGSTNSSSNYNKR